MDNKTNDNTFELLRKMAAVQRRSERLTLIITLVTLVMAAALIFGLLFLVPKLSAVLDTAYNTLGDTQQIIQRLNTSLDNLDSFGETLGGLTGEGSENLEKLINTLNTLDLNAFTEAIQNFNGVLERLSNFRLFG
jgi:predicted PurR-regulated permease PerM